MRRSLFTSVVALCLFLLSSSISAQTEQEVMTFMGDRYVIHVDAMKPDKEMTLMDVLLTCQEMLSNNGKFLTEYYDIRIDNISLPMDEETILHALKASEISTIQICVFTSVAKGGDGAGGVVDIYLKEQEAGKTNGKVLLEGSTRGNGKFYTDVKTHSNNVTVRGYALTHLQYARGPLTNMDRYRERQGVEDIHLDVNWDISEKDNLKLKLFQGFQDSKLRLYDNDKDADQISMLQRYWAGVASYTRTLNDQDATVTAEGGVDHLCTTSDGIKKHDTFTYYFTEFNIPCFRQALNIMAGWEIDYDNCWTVGGDRQQMMFNDFYVQLEYHKGPWLLALGDRLRKINYWNRDYQSDDTSLWKHHRTENSYLASIGYKAGRHFFQGVLNRDYIVPFINDFYMDLDDDMNRRVYNINYHTHLIRRAEARYTYQHDNLLVSGSVLHTWSDNDPTFDQQSTGFRASVTWWKGPLRLTASADFYHEYIKGVDEEGRNHDNFFNLRLLPTLTLPKGFRLSATLFYNSRHNLIEEIHPHLYASLKIHKDFGRHLTLSADFHDLAGTPRLSSHQANNAFDNRALTLGLTYRY